MISKDKAFSIASRLAVMDGYPRTPEAIAQVALLLAEFVQSDPDGEKLLTEMLSEFDRWPGPRTLRMIYREHVAPRKGQDGPSWEKPTLCPTCESWGWVQQGDRFDACQCEAGRTIDPRVLEHLNRSKAPLVSASSISTPTNLKLITLADVEAERERIKRLKESA